MLFYVLFVLYRSILFVCKGVLLPPGDNPIAVNKYIIYHINVKIDLQEMGGGMDWIDLAQNTDRWPLNGL